ncbi:hypothetical protein BGW41_005301 [Actinomortierella wolfii]|nr:hypothetical protein BGW41_005301 [Actinomortierella wolfii]
MSLIQRRYFLWDPNKPRINPHFGIENINQNGDNTSLVSLENDPEEFSALYPPSIPWSKHYKNPGQDEMSSQQARMATQYTANFPGAGPGQYALYLKIKQCSYEETTARFVARIIVRYAKTCTTEVFFTRFYKREEGPVLSHHEKSSISPPSLHVYGKSRQSYITHAPNVADKPNNNKMLDHIAPTGNNPAPSLETTEHTDNGTLTRLVASKDGRFLAGLTVFSSRIFIQVWQYVDGNKSFTTNHSSTTIVHHNIDQISVALAISNTGDKVAIYQVPKTGDWFDEKPKMDVYLFRNRWADDSLEDKNSLIYIQTPPALREIIGFATFVDKFVAGDTVLPSRFVFCDGREIHVFASDQYNFELTNIIPLNTMYSSLWRTTACELLIRSIATKMFVWVEDNGRYCSTWDLSTGVAMGRFKITDSQYAGPVGITEIQIACNRDTIAIVGLDSSITTVDATTGVLCDRYELPDRIIDHIVFPSAHSRMLVAMVRGEDDNQQTALVLDALQLEVQEELGFIPSASRLTIISSFGSMKWPEIGLVCQPDVQQIHFYPCKAQVMNSAIVPAGISYPYRLEKTIPQIRRGASKGQAPVKRQVEIWKNTERIFSFIPEPWERKTIKAEILPTNDRFVVCGSWTIQVWSLPRDGETKCRLLYYWSSRKESPPKKSFNKSDMDIVLENHHHFISAHIPDFEKESTNSLRVGLPDKTIKKVAIPDFPMRIGDKITTHEHCVKSSHLLALTYCELQRDELYRDIYSDHVQALINYVNAFINDTIELDDQDVSTTNIMMNLMMESCPVGISGKFIEGLLNDALCPWLPRYDKDSDPLLVATMQKNDDAIRAILHYFARKAHTSHLNYAMPVENSFIALADYYPGLLREFFRQTSYITAMNIDFIEDFVTIFSNDWQVQWRNFVSWIMRSKIGPSTFKDYYMPVFTFQLPEYRTENDVVNSKGYQPRAIELRYDQKVYTVPFPSLLKPSPTFSKLAGNNFFDSPLQMAVLIYKAMMITQIQRSVAVKSLQDLQNLYFDGFWKVLLILDLLLGLAFLIFEIIQCVHDKPRRYFTTFFNYINLSALLFTTICLLGTLITQFAIERHPGEAPKQLSYIPFANVVIFLHVIVEFRMFQTFGIFVNILFEVIKSIVSFLAIFVVLMIAFDQGMVYLLYTYQNTCVADGLCARTFESDFPSEPFSSFASTLFFLAGRFDDVNKDFDSKRSSFLLLMIMIYIIGFIIMLALLIGHVTESIAAAKAESKRAWRRQLSETLAEAELFDKILGKISYNKLSLLRKNSSLPMAIEDYPSFTTPDNMKEQSVPELVPQAHLEPDNASTAFDDTISRDNIDFDFEEESVVEESSVWKDRAIRELFLNARDEYEKFELALKTDKRRRPFETVSDPYPPTDKPATRQAQRKWFLVLENRLEDDPFLGIDDLPSESEPPEVMLVQSLPSTKTDIEANEASDIQGRTTEKLKLRATFRSVATGHYTMYLRIKQATKEKTSVRFLARIVVRYTKTRMTDVFYVRFSKGVRDEYEGWHYLKAGGQFEIRAHHEIAQVNVRIVQDERYNKAQRGKLWIRSLELVPVELKPIHQEPIVSHIGRPQLTITTLSSTTESLTNTDDQRYAEKQDKRPDELGIVTRVVTSNGGDFFAILTVFSDHVVAKVWSKSEVEGAGKCNEKVSQLGATSEYIHCSDAQNLSLELVISPSGEYIAIFQPPKAGDWQVGDSLPTSELGVCFFRNPLISAKDVMVMIANGDHIERCLERLEYIPSNLQDAVGYAAFVDDDATPSESRFVFCNGLYLDVFEANSDGLVHSHTISLVSKATGLSRTIACEMMMDSITSNMFIWVEEDGRYCTTWDLSNGSAIGRFEISRRQRMTSTSLNTLKFARSQNIVAIAGFDNSITTLDAYSGMEISRRQFRHHIEHITFPSTQSQILVVMLRQQEENEQRVLIFDPLQLDVKGLVQIGPPLSRSTIFDVFGPKSWPGLGDVCRLDGHLVHFYTSKDSASTINASRPSAMSAVPESCPYELRTTAPKYRRKAGGGQESCRRQVEVWRKSDPSICVFSFIPEPWEQDTPARGMILPTGDRFVVYSSWTIQLWSLPNDQEPRCKLVFFWSALGDTRGYRVEHKSDIEAILDSYSQFDSMSCKETTANDGQTRFHATVVFPGQNPVRVPIPDSPVRVDDFKNITEHCIRSIHLLALTHSVVSTEYRDVEVVQHEGNSYEDHTWAIINFVVDHINHFIQPQQMTPTFFNALQSYDGPKISVLTQLLREPCPNDVSAKFIASLLESNYCNWVPRKDVTVSPLEMAIDRRNTAAVEAFLDYCTTKAYRHHPAYMNPVEKTLDKLQRHYPELLRAALRKASFIQARRDDFCKDWVKFASFGRPALKRPAFPRLNFIRRRFREPIAIFQLPTSHSLNSSDRLTKFENIPAPMPVRLEYEYAWYVVPFPSLLDHGPDSQFCNMAGENFFDSPVLMAVLRYKPDVPHERLEKYLGPNWLALVIFGLAVGCYLLVLEFVQFRYIGLEYLRLQKLAYSEELEQL